MSIVFFGSSKYSTIVEKTLQQQFGLSLVVTIPDQILGRKKIPTPSPVKQVAIENKIPVLTADKLTNDVIGHIAQMRPDFLIVADYRLILPKKLLEIPKFAAINVHHSLLPKYRGPAPAPFAILGGEKISGVTIIEIGERVDNGDILDQKEYTLQSNETTDSLLTRLNHLGAEAIVPILKDFHIYHEKRKKQNEEYATYTHYMNKNDGFINLDNPPKKEQLDRMIRAYYPWPNVWTRIRINPSVSLRTSRELRIKLLPGNTIQPEGKKPMNVKDFLNGYPEAKETLKKILD